MTDAVLVVGFGGPETPDDVMPFLERVTAGRGVPRERLAEVAEHYLVRGGHSPINDQTRALVAALTERLRTLGVELPVVLGQRNAAPFVDGAVAGLAAAGHRDVLAVATSAYASYSGCRQYREDLGLARERAGTDMIIRKLPPFAGREWFAAAVAAVVAPALAAAPPGTEVLFSTHSLPVASADRSGPPSAWGGGGAYVAQHRALAEAVMTRLDAPQPWRLVFQSRSGPPRVPWLAPDVNEAIVDAAGRGVRHVVVVPFGFLTDHVEVSWDLDTEAARTAAEHHVGFVRVPTVGENPVFLDGLAGDIAAALVTPQHPPAAGESCTAECCPARTPRPAVEGVHP